VSFRSSIESGSNLREKEGTPRITEQDVIKLFECNLRSVIKASYRTFICLGKFSFNSSHFTDEPKRLPALRQPT
jgi:hypothetical protein